MVLFVKNMFLAYASSLVLFDRKYIFTIIVKMGLKLNQMKRKEIISLPFKITMALL